MINLDEHDHLAKECASLEERAGIVALIKRAKEGHLIPLTGENVTAQEYFAFEYDYLREKTRDAYFSIKDNELKKQLIKLKREMDAEHTSTIQNEIYQLHRDMVSAKAQAEVYPWQKGALAGVGVVALGYWVFGIVGALAGAVVGFFFGQGLISKSRNMKKSVLDDISESLAESRKDKAKNSLVPNFFTYQEEDTGERNKEFDNESAWENVLRLTAEKEQGVAL